MHKKKLVIKNGPNEEQSIHTRSCLGCKLKSCLLDLHCLGPCIIVFPEQHWGVTHCDTTGKCDYRKERCDHHCIKLLWWLYGCCLGCSVNITVSSCIEGLQMKPHMGLKEEKPFSSWASGLFFTVDSVNLVTLLCLLCSACLEAQNEMWDLVVALVQNITWGIGYAEPFSSFYYLFTSFHFFTFLIFYCVYCMYL